MNRNTLRTILLGEVDAVQLVFGLGVGGQHVDAVLGVTEQLGKLQRN